MMVAFVGSAKNYKSLYNEQRDLALYAQAELAKKDQLFNDQMAKYKTQEAELTAKLLAMEAESNQLKADLRKNERLVVQYQSQADSWKGVMTGFEQSVRNLQASLQQTQQQLDAARAQGINDRKELSQITTDLYAKIIQLQSMEAERRRLLEQKTELEKQLSGAGVGAISIQPVTPTAQRDVLPASAVSTAAVRGLVKDIDETLVHLSVGSADGVRENMVFHITRGDQFLCDVVVTHVDINQSVGVLDLVKQRPQVGDTASTQL